MIGRVVHSSSRFPSPAAVSWPIGASNLPITFVLGLRAAHWSLAAVLASLATVLPSPLRVTGWTSTKAPLTSARVLSWSVGHLSNAIRVIRWSPRASPLAERTWRFGRQFLSARQLCRHGRRWTALHHPRHDHVDATILRRSTNSSRVTMASDAISIWRAVHPHRAALCPAQSPLHSTDSRRANVHRCPSIEQVVCLAVRWRSLTAAHQQ